MIDLSTIEARKAIGTKYATKYGLDPALVCALIEHESTWNAWACRYEPTFMARYIQPLLNNGTVKTMTEATMRSSSFGLMQVLGQVAREMGFGGKFLTELCDPDVGVDFGCKKLQKCFLSHPEARGALLSYNGGGDPSYPDLVLQFVSKYQD